MAEDYKSESWLREKYWDEGKLQSEIADELDVDISTVSRWMKKHNIEKRSKSEGDIRKLRDGERLRREYKNKQKSQVEIAEELGVDSSTVDRWMKKHGIETRSYSEAASTGGNIRKLRDEEWLREQYKNQRKSTLEIADELDVSASTVSRWIDKHGIEKRSQSERQSEGNIERLWNGEWLREQYENQQKTTYEIAEELNVGRTTVCDWLKRHGITIRSSIIYPEYTTHIVRSEWELEICNILIEEGVDYSYESIEVEYYDGSTYVPDFVTDEYVIEVKGAYFSEIHNYENTEHKKALATMESLNERNYVVVGQELPADIHIPWEERSKIRELFSNTQAEPTASQSDYYNTP